MDSNGSGKATEFWRGLATRDWLSFGRADYLGMKVILGLAAVGSVLFGLVGPVVDAATNAPLPVSYTARVTSGIELPRGATHDGWASVELLVKDATSAERFTQALPGVLLASVTVVIAWLLFQLLRSTQAGEPFIRRNVSRINMTGLAVGVGGTLVQVAQGVADNAIWSTGRLPARADVVFVMGFTALPLVVMLVIALIGETFRRGVELRDDVEGLV